VIVQWDDWVPQDRVRKFTEENKELAAQLHNQMKALQQKPTKAVAGKKGGRTNGSDFSSARGSEERTASVAAQSGRGRGRRDYEIENVSLSVNFLLSCTVQFTKLGPFWFVLPDILSGGILRWFQLHLQKSSPSRPVGPSRPFDKVSSPNANISQFANTNDHTLQCLQSLEDDRLGGS
jgi:hypothetical protein